MPSTDIKDYWRRAWGIGDRSKFKPGGIVEPGVTHYAKKHITDSLGRTYTIDTDKWGRPTKVIGSLLETNIPLKKRVIELLNEGLTKREVSKIVESEGLVKFTTYFDNTKNKQVKAYGNLEKNYDKLLAEGELKIKEIGKLSESTIKRNNALLKIIKDNPNLNPDQLARKATNDLNTKINRSVVTRLADKKGINLITRSEKILPEIEALDKLIKKNSVYLSKPNKEVSIAQKHKFLFNEMKKKFPNLAPETFGDRLHRVGKLWAGTAKDRTTSKIYQHIKAPLNYADSMLHKNIVGMASKSFLGVVDKAKLLKLPDAQIKLLQDVLKGSSELTKLKIAGDHTDIDALMKNFKDYKKNFTRINIISDKLNTAKLAADNQLIKLVNDLKLGIINRDEFNQQVKKIRTQFTKKTGVPIGHPVADKKGNLNLKFQTERIIDLKNPRWNTINKAATNLMEQSGVKITGIDEKLRNVTSWKERFNILKNATSAELNKSKMLRGFSKMKGKVGVFTKLLLAGTIGNAALQSLAQAEELEPSDKTQEAGILSSVISDHPILSSAAAVTAAAPKKVWEGAKWAAKKLTPIMTPGISTLIHGGPQNLDPTSGQDLSTVAFWKHATDWMGARSRWGNKMIGLKKRLRDIALRGGLPTRFLPLISGTASVAAGPMLIKDAAKWLQSNIDKEGLTGKIEEQSFIGDEAGAGYLMEEAYDKKRSEDAEGMDYFKGGIASLKK